MPLPLLGVRLRRRQPTPAMAVPQLPRFALMHASQRVLPPPFPPPLQAQPQLCIMPKILASSTLWSTQDLASLDAEI